MRHSQIDKADGFELIGHSNPLGEYPAPVVPIVRQRDRYFSVYLGDNAIPILKDIRADLIERRKSGFIAYGKTYGELINKFQLTEHRLYALSKNDVQAYKPDEQSSFFDKILKRYDIFKNNPFAALDVSELIGDAALIMNAERMCYASFAEIDEDIARDWYGKERGRDLSLMPNATKRAEKKTVYYGTGRRKEAVARVYAKSGDGRFTVNYKVLEEYFSRPTDRMLVLQPLNLLSLSNRMDVNVIVKGGGPTGQAGACRHGLSRALVELDENNRKPLRDQGYLTRDSREVERKKVGLHKARKAPQYSKR